MINYLQVKPQVLKIAVVLLLFFVLVAGARADSFGPIFDTPLSPRIANYDIDVRLDPEKRTLYGKEVLSWRNPSENPIDELRFHLYLNAFGNNKSTAFIEAAKILRSRGIGEDGWGYIEVTRIALPTGDDLTDDLKFIQPDDENKNDKTVFSLPLVTPILPGESIELEIDFTSVLPTPPLRTGAKEEYFFVAQWFPKVGVYLDGEWNCHQFHASSEFFADFGVYDVRITVPEENIVGATGLEVDVKRNSDGTATHTYHAEDVHDFAWTTSPEFVEFLGSAENVKIRVLMQPDHVHQGRRYVNAAEVAIAYLHDWIGDYPYPNLTVVDPRRGAMGSGGMEYPTLITAGTVYGLPTGLRFAELVIIHEYAHNYWYHLVASNEFEESWLDEGFTEYSEIKIMNHAYGPTADTFDFMGLVMNDSQLCHFRYLFHKDLDPMARFAWKYYSRNSYRNNSYLKPALMLLTLENYIGEETMQKVLRTYFERWRFKHPKTKNFIDIANEISGQNLDWFFDQILNSNAELDYSVDHVSTEEVEEGKGYDFTLVRLSDEVPKQDGEEKKKLYHSEIRIRRLGELIFPVEIQMNFEGDETVRESWDGRDTWKKISYIKPKKLISATVDPEGQILLDINFTNNSKKVEPEIIGIVDLALKTLFGAQLLFDQPEIANLFTFFLDSELK
ncbi:MAG: M1 family metallopeptidase [Proteobacteria bacterium]|nr:M1 family metallopeptidase [Pseudomonadota bacterium]